MKAKDVGFKILINGRVRGSGYNARTGNNVDTVYAKGAKKKKKILQFRDKTD